MPLNEWMRLRRQVLIRDRYACRHCGRKANEVDHIINKASGGTDDMGNLQALCHPCHLKKTKQEAAAGRARAGRARLRDSNMYLGPRRSI